MPRSLVATAARRAVRRGGRVAWSGAAAPRCVVPLGLVTTTTNQTTARTLAIERPLADDDFMVFPRERPGLDYALNWSLNGDGVTPGGDAFRITKEATAVELLAGAPVDALGAAATAAPVVDDEDEYEAAFDAVVEVLEAAKTLYVAEGDAAGTRLPCRVITPDLALAATAMKHIVERMPLKEPVELPLTCYVAPTGDAIEAIAFPEDGVGRVILSGPHATAAKLKACVDMAAATILEEKENQDEIPAPASD